MSVLIFDFNVYTGEALDFYINQNFLFTRDTCSIIVDMILWSIKVALKSCISFTSIQISYAEDTPGTILCFRFLCGQFIVIKLLKRFIRFCMRTFVFRQHISCGHNKPNL